MNRGFAFLEFSSRSDAMNAFKRLQKRDVLFGVDRPAKVSFADSFIGPGDEIMAQVNIYLTDMLKIYISSKTVSTVSSTLYAAIFGAVYLVSSYCICP